MSFDLFEKETAERMMNLVPARVPEIGVFDGFVRGTAMHTMRHLAQFGSAADIAGAVVPIAQDAFTGGTEAQDRYFREHDEIFGKAADFWTPKPLEVGAASEIAGQLISTLPLIIANPGLAVGATQLGTAEELVQRGVSAGKAQAVGAVQGAGLGIGIYMPIFGRTLAERIIAGGIGFNLAQGVVMRGASGAILQGTPAAEDYKAFDTKALTLDTLLGAAFGAIVHLSPTQRAQGAEMWTRIENWAKGLKQTDIDALSVLRQAQHLNVDSLAGRPVDPVDVERHVQRVKTAMEQLVRDQPINVSDLPAPHLEVDQARAAEDVRNVKTLAAAAEDVRKTEGLPATPRVQIPENTTTLTPEQRAVETRARAAVQADLEGFIRRYDKLPDSEGGKVINTDIARELFPEYQHNREIHSPSVHEPASAVVKEVYAQKLTEVDPNGLNMVSFTAGGTGAGKSTGIGSVELASSIRQASQIVYDTNLSNARSGGAKIDQALAAGKQVNIMFVGLDPEEAFRRMLKRATRMGRTVPMVDHIGTHRGAIDTVIELQQRYADDPRVKFYFLDNGSGARGEASLIPRAKGEEWLRSFNFDNLEGRLQRILDAEYKAGRISEKVYRGTAPVEPGAAGAAPGRGNAEKPAGGGQEGQGRAPLEEVDFNTPPKAGEPVLVFRLGNEGGLENRNAGNTGAIGRFLQRLDDVEGPQPAGRKGEGGQVITAYEVKAPKGFGDYTSFDQQRAKGQVDLPGRRAIGKTGTDIEYSFPKEAGAESRPLASVTIEEVRATLEKISGLKNFDDAGGALSARALRETIASKLPGSEAPAAPRGGAEPPPPRGSRLGEAAGAKGTPQIETPAFKEWFGNSKVVDEQGKPLVVYHGTRQVRDAPESGFSQFTTEYQRSGVAMGKGFYVTTSQEVASGIAERRQGGYVMPLYVRAENPIKAEALVAEFKKSLKGKHLPDDDFIKEMNKYARAKGYDAIVEDETILVFDSSQLKSAIGNSGAFAKTSGDVIDQARPDPMRAQAEQVALDQPEFKMRVGQDANGNPITKTVKQFLEDAQTSADNARQDVGLFEAAARCLLGA